MWPSCESVHDFYSRSYLCVSTRHRRSPYEFCVRWLILRNKKAISFNVADALLWMSNERTNREKKRNRNNHIVCFDPVWFLFLVGTNFLVCVCVWVCCIEKSADTNAISGQLRKYNKLCPWPWWSSAEHPIHHVLAFRVMVASFMKWNYVRGRWVCVCDANMQRPHSGRWRVRVRQIDRPMCLWGEKMAVNFFVVVVFVYCIVASANRTVLL